MKLSYHSDNTPSKSANSVNGSALYEQVFLKWIGNPYPLLVDHTDTGGRVCPAASLYTYGRHYSTLLKPFPIEPGEVIACSAHSWIHWIGMLLGTLRRGLTFAPLPLSPKHDHELWVANIDPTYLLREETGKVEILNKSRPRLPPYSWVLGPSQWTENKILESSGVAALQETTPVWLANDMTPEDHVIALLSVLRARAEVHVGLNTEEILKEASSKHHMINSQGQLQLISEAK